MAGPDIVGPATSHFRTSAEGEETIVRIYVRRLLAADLRGERGATATEYGLLVGFIAIAIVLGVTAFGLAVNGWFGDMAATVAGIL